MKQLKYSILILYFSIVSIPRLIADNSLQTNKKEPDYHSDSLKASEYNNKSSALTYENPDSSIWYAEKGLDVVRKYQDEDFLYKQVQLLTNLGIAYSIKSNYTAAIEQYLKINNILDPLIKQHPKDIFYKQGLVVNYANIGLLYYLDKQFDLSLKNLLKAVPFLKYATTNEQRGQMLNNIGINYLEKKDYLKTLDYYNKALTYFKKDPALRSMAMAYSNLGEVYNDMGKPDKAFDYLTKAIKIKKQLKDYYGLEVAYYNVANVYFSKTDYSKAIIYSKKSVDLAVKIDNSHDAIKSLKLLSDSYAANKTYQKAYEALLRMKKLNDSVFTVQSDTKFHELQTKYETQKKETEILFLKQKEKQTTLERKATYAGIGLLLVIFVLALIFLYNKRKHEKQLLESQLEKKRVISEELHKEVTFKSKQLTTHALNMMQKNNMLNDLKKDLEIISKEAKPEVKSALSHLNLLINANLKSEKEWEMFRIYFEQVDRDFYSRLTENYPKLNNTDLRHCALLKLNMNLKETASVLNLSTNTIKSARNRLKKKLNLDANDDLTDFIRKV